MLKYIHAPVVQRIEYGFAEPGIAVQFCSGALTHHDPPPPPPPPPPENPPPPNPDE